MQRHEITPEFQKILKTAFTLAGDVSASALLILADRAYDFAALKRDSKGFRLIVASDKKDVQEAVRLDDVDVVVLSFCFPIVSTHFQHSLTPQHSSTATEAAPVAHKSQMLTCQIVDQYLSFQSLLYNKTNFKIALKLFLNNFYLFTW